MVLDLRNHRGRVGPWLALILLACLCLSVAPTRASEKRFVSVPDLQADLRTKNIDLIVQTMNDIKRMTYTGQILPFLQDLWLEKRDVHPDLPWETVVSDRVKVEVAEILMQARQNNFVDLDSEPFRHYARSLIDSKDVMVVWGAIRILRAIDDERDVDAIIAAAQTRSNMGIFRTAVLSLAWMCNDAAAQGLSRLEKESADHEQKAFVKEIRQKFDASRSESNWCSK